MGNPPILRNASHPPIISPMHHLMIDAHRNPEIAQLVFPEQGDIVFDDTWNVLFCLILCLLCIFALTPFSSENRRLIDGSQLRNLIQIVYRLQFHLTQFLHGDKPVHYKPIPLVCGEHGGALPTCAIQQMDNGINHPFLQERELGSLRLFPSEQAKQSV